MEKLLVTSTLCSQVPVHAGLYLYDIGGETGGFTPLPLKILVSTVREEPEYTYSILMLEHARDHPEQEIWPVV